MSQNVFNRRQYTQQHHEMLTTFRDLSSLGVDTPHILIRVNTENVPEDTTLPEYYKYDDIDTFAMITSDLIGLTYGWGHAPSDGMWKNGLLPACLRMIFG